MTVFYWQHIDPWWAAAAMALMLMGIGLIYRAWRWQKHSGLWPGWLLLALSLTGWTVAGGLWIGLPTGISVLMLLVIIWIAWQGQWPTRATAVNGDTALANRKGAASDRRAVCLRLLAAFPLAAVFALTVTLVLAQAVAAGADRVFTERLAVTLIWAAGAVWACTATRPQQPAIMMGAASATAVLILLLMR